MPDAINPVLSFERVLAARRAAVYAAFVDPDRLCAWWPHATAASLEPEVEGSWEVQVGSGGQPGRGVVRKLETGRRLVWSWHHDTGHESRLMVLFQDWWRDPPAGLPSPFGGPGGMMVGPPPVPGATTPDPDGTTVHVLQSGFATEGARDALRPHWENALARLEQLLP